MIFDGLSLMDSNMEGAIVKISEGKSIDSFSIE